MRVTDSSRAYSTLAGLQQASARLTTMQAKLSSGKQITTPSDDPAGTVRALQLRGDLKRNAQYQNSAQDAIGWMSTSDSAYTQIVKLVQNARSLTVQALNTGSGNSTSANAIADQVDAIRTSLINVANTTYNGRPVFGGTTSGQIAYNAAGTYVGDNGAVTRQVGEQSTVQVNQTGPQAFGSGASDLFALLANISATMRTNPSALGADLTSLDSSLSTISTAQATEGATYQQVQGAQAVQMGTATALSAELSSIQDIDLAKTAVDVSTANVTYQAALQTTANVRQLSLLEFLK